MTLNDFINEAFYRDYLITVEERLAEKIVEIDPKYIDIILNFENESLRKAGVSTDDLKWLIENHRGETAQYIAIKIKIFREPDGGEEGIVNLPPTIDFPIGHLIEYFLILNKPELLDGYIRSIHIPSAKKYVKEIKKVFDDVQQA